MPSPTWGELAWKKETFPKLGKLESKIEGLPQLGKSIN